MAASIVTALTEGWTTADLVDGPTGRKVERWRPLRPGDITVLVPARTSLGALEKALDRAGVLYRTESSSLVYHAQEVRDLFAACRAIADPSDAFALVTALRTPLFGCGDDDLWTWKRDGGSFNLRAPLPEELEDHPVGRAVAYLARLHYDSRWMTPSEVLGRLAVDRRMFEVASFGPRARDSWRRLRFVIDQARAWSEAEHGGLRAYLGWARAQAAETSRVAESVLPESDSDSVRIMTIHAAKGLEFPMVVLSGLTSQPRNNGGVRVFWKDDGYAVSLAKDLATGDFQEQVPLDEQMSDYERMRLLYVGATRARDHLVVSLHRSGGARSPTPAASPTPVRLPRVRCLCSRRMVSRWVPRRAPRSLPRRSSTGGSPVCGRLRTPAGGGPRSAHRAWRAPSPTPRWTMDWQARRPARHARVSDGSGSGCGLRRRPPCRPRQGRPRPRAAGLGEGPLRLGDRPRRPRRAADGRPRDGRGSGRGGRRLSAWRRASSSSPSSSRRLCGRPSTPRWSGGRRCESTGASPTSAWCKRTAPSLKAWSTSSTAKTTARWSSSTTRPTTCPTRLSPLVWPSTDPSSTPTQTSSRQQTGPPWRSRVWYSLAARQVPRP